MRLRHLARTTDRPSGDIVRDVINEIHPDAVATMTPVNLLKKQVQNLRKRNGIQRPGVPQVKNGWEVPNDLQFFLQDGGRFLQVRHFYYYSRILI